MTATNICVQSIYSVADDRGLLVVAEAGKEVPFNIARIFAITGVEHGNVRGGHAHKKLSQMLICISGMVEVTVDDGKERNAITLDHPTKALLVPPGIWAEQTYSSSDTILLVLCDRVYEEEDYIRNYQEFVKSRLSTGQAE